VDSIWEIGQETVPGVFLPAVRYYISDDHISLIKYGIRAIDIIDFDYQPYWHTKDDTVDKCSAENLEKMYQFLLRMVYPPEPY
jgi:glutaminyl-peptide cyclotransferase